LPAESLTRDAERVMPLGVGRELLEQRLQKLRRLGVLAAARVREGQVVRPAGVVRLEGDVRLEGFDCIFRLAGPEMGVAEPTVCVRKGRIDLEYVLEAPGRVREVAEADEGEPEVEPGVGVAGVGLQTGEVLDRGV